MSCIAFWERFYKSVNRTNDTGSFACPDGEAGLTAPYAAIFLNTIYYPAITYGWIAAKMFSLVSNRQRTPPVCIVTSWYCQFRAEPDLVALAARRFSAHYQHHWPQLLAQ